MPKAFTGRVQAVKAQELAEPNSILIFGHPKRGKTTLAGSIADVAGFDNVLHIDLEDGSAPLAAPYPNIDVLRPSSVDELTDALNELKTSVDDEGFADAMGYQAVILDTVSTLQKWVLDEYLAKHPTKSGKTDYDGWAYWGDYVMDVMWELHRLPALGITTYHTKIELNELTKEIWTSPKISGGARFSVASVPDLVGYLDVDNKGERVFTVTPKKSMQTGSRYESVLPGALAAPTMSDIFAAIRGEE
jgi:hypothetical protein